MKLRVALAADRAASALHRLTSDSAWRDRSSVAAERELVVELAAALASVNTAVTTQLPGDPEAPETMTVRPVNTTVANNPETPYNPEVT